MILARVFMGFGSNAPIEAGVQVHRSAGGVKFGIENAANGGRKGWASVRLHDTVPQEYRVGAHLVFVTTEVVRQRLSVDLLLALDNDAHI